MASPDMVVKVKRHSHPLLVVLSLAALVIGSVALKMQACPPVPAPAAAPAPVADKPIVSAPVVAPVLHAPVIAPAVEAAPAVVAPAPVSEVKPPVSL